MSPIIKFRSRLPLFLYALSDLVLPLFLLWLLQLSLTNAPWKEVYVWLGLAAGFSMVVGVSLLYGYSRYSERSIAQKLQLVFTVWIFVVLGLIFLAYLNVVVQEFSRKVIISWTLLTPIVLLLMRVLIVQIYFAVGRATTRVLLLSKYEFTAFEKARLAKQNIEVFFLDGFEGLEEKSKELKPNFVVLNADSSQSPGLVRRLTQIETAGIRLISFESFMEEFLRKCYVNYELADLGFLQEITPYSRLHYLLKRVVDISAALVLGIITSPVMVYAVWRIRRESPGPVIFSQQRVGLKGKEFKIYKFRSMHENAEFNPYTSEDDKRVFEFGNRMRKSRIDELPQLWNVLKGDMHLFGPRSEWNILVQNYENEIPFYNERHLVAPGISGWAQVMYPYGSCTEDARQKLMYDLYYIKNWSIWLEMETLIRTVGVVLGKKGL